MDYDSRRGWGTRRGGSGGLSRRQERPSRPTWCPPALLGAALLGATRLVETRRPQCGAGRPRVSVAGNDASAGRGAPDCASWPLVGLTSARRRPAVYWVHNQRSRDFVVRRPRLMTTLTIPNEAPVAARDTSSRVRSANDFVAVIRSLLDEQEFLSREQMAPNSTSSAGRSSRRQAGARQQSSQAQVLGWPRTRMMMDSISIMTPRCRGPPA